MELIDRVHHPMIWPVVNEWLPRTPARILDAGCGQGQFSYRMAQLGHDVTGVEIDPDSLKLARDLLARSDHKWEIIAGSLEAIELPTASFDTAVCIEVVEHLYRPIAALKNIANALKTGGRLILSTPYHGWLKNVAIAASGHWDQHHCTMQEGGHIKFWSNDTLGQTLAMAGLHPVEWRGVGRLPYLWKSIIVRAEK
jgi:2-polyprenyl-3-methyl-5-hydroxy-6-metoxy-1,4-benzoquinol methylase